MTGPTQHLRRLRIGASIAAILLALSALGLALYLREQSRREQLDVVNDVAQTVSQSLSAWVGTIDYVLQVSADEIEHQTGAHRADAAAINAFLALQQERFRHIDLLRAANANGEVVWGRGVDPAQRVSLAQRDYFRQLRDEPRPGMVIAEPIVGRISQQWIWLMARRLNGPDGGFAGVVYASMFIRDLARMFEQASVPPGGAIWLRDARLRRVAGTGAPQPTPPADPQAEARHLAALGAAIAAHPDSGSFVGPAPDGEGAPTTYAYRRHPVYGYTLVAGQPLAAADAAWRNQALVVAGLLVATLALLANLVKVMRQGWEQAALVDTLSLRDREHALLKSLIRTIPDLVWLKDPQGVYLACNAEFERFMGRPEAEIVGRTDYDLTSRDIAQQFRAHDRAAAAAGRPTVNEEWITYATDGRRALLKTTKTPMVAPEGALAGVLGVGHDITVERRNAQDLRDSEDQLARANAELEARVEARTAELVRANRRLVDTQFAMDEAGIGITWVDFETGRFTWANRFAAELLGYSRDELLTMRVSDIDPIFTPEQYERAKPRFVAEGHRRFETEHLARDGHRIPVEMTVYYDHQDPGTKPRLIAFSAVIAARKEAERQALEAKAAAEAANRAKSVFLANMSHEIRTPLNALLGLGHLLRGEPLSATQRDRLDKMDGAGRHLLTLVNDILDLSKVEAGRLQIETANFHLSAVLDHVYSLVREAAAAKDLAVQVDSDGVPQWLRGDPTRLRQALLNFAGNAVKFTDRGRVCLRARLLDEQGERLRVRFEVEDTGPGLDAGQRARLFQVFEQVDVSPARRHGGTGLGLALSKRLIELMEGRIGVDSEPGRGSLFWFEVPLARGHGPVPEEGRPVHPAGAEDHLRRQYRGARVLLAEDNEINIEVVQEMLHAVGLDVVVADNGRAAVERAAQGVFDLVLMDMQMPEMDGLEATRRIRAMAGHAATPILALTANAFADDRQACLDAGMDAMLTKPVDPALLYESMLEWLQRGADRRAPAGDPLAPGTTPPVEATIAHLRERGDVDVDAALRRLRGQVGRYDALLRQFVGLHEGDPGTVRELLADGRRDEARARMHRLKGASALLGLGVISAEAARLEALFKAGPGPDEAGTLAGATARIAEAIDALAQLLGSPS